MVVRGSETSLERVGVHSTGCAFMFAGDYLHPIAFAESVLVAHGL